MTEKRLLAHIESMRNAASNAVSLVESLSYDQFVGDPNAQAATAMFLIIVGEAAVRIAQLSPSFVDSHEQFPWERMRGLRNRIVHDYETLHLPTIWATAKDALPALLAEIDALGPIGEP